MNTHWQNVQSLVDLGRILTKDGFDYTGYPLAFEYDLFFRFGQEELNTSFEKGVGGRENRLLDIQSN